MGNEITFDGRKLASFLRFVSWVDYLPHLQINDFEINLIFSCRLLHRTIEGRGANATNSERSLTNNNPKHLDRKNIGFYLYKQTNISNKQTHTHSTCIVHLTHHIRSCMIHTMLTASQTDNFMMLLLLNESIRQLHWKCEYKVRFVTLYVEMVVWAKIL